VQGHLVCFFFRFLEESRRDLVLDVDQKGVWLAEVFRRGSFSSGAVGWHWLSNDLLKARSSWIAWMSLSLVGAAGDGATCLFAV
jgi:hypothetical protein